MNMTLRSMLLPIGLAAGVCAYAQAPADSVPAEQEELQEVVVTAAKHVIKAEADKTTYEVADDPEAQALTLLDLLRKVPGVTVDAQDNVTINGSSNFSVEVDGRANPIFSQNGGKILKSIPASMVQRVEVLNSPGARYDAEGVGGVLNIVMKHTKESLDGYSLTIQGEGNNCGGDGSIHAMMQKGRLGATLNVSGGSFTQPWMTIGLSRTSTEGMLTEYLSRINNGGNWLNASLDLNFALTDADRLVLSGSWSRSKWNTTQHADVQTGLKDSPLQKYLSDSKTDSKYLGIVAGADYSHIFRGDSRNKLRIAYQFNSNPTDMESADTYSLPAGAEAGAYPLPEALAYSNHSNMPEHIAQAEYSLPIGEHHSIEAGGKMTWRRSISQGKWEDYAHHTDIAAAFISYGFKTGDFAAKAGLRYEHTSIDAHFNTDPSQDFSSRYNNLVPSASLSYQLRGFSSLSASYSMRISRPGISYLNPAYLPSGALQAQQGNPFLTPERHNNIDIAYTGVFGTLTLVPKLFYSFSNDGITQLSYTRGDVLVKTYTNGLHSKRIGLQLFANLRLFAGKTTIMGTLTPQYTNLRAQYLANHGWGFNIFAGVNQELPWHLTLSANIFANTRPVTLQGKSMSQFVHMLSLTRPFLKEDRMQVTLTAINPFYSRMNIRMNERGTDYTQDMTGHLNMQIFQVGVQIRLGNLKQKIDTRNTLDSDATATDSKGSSISPSIGM